MADPFVAEIRIVGFNFAPKGWAACDGQILPISQNTALFSLIGTFYGGNGTSNFALPNLQGRVPLNPGQGPGSSLYDVGETGGEATVTLTTSQLPAHTHTLNTDKNAGETTSPTNQAPAQAAVNPRFADLYSGAAANATASPSAIGSTGSGLPHNNLQPYLTLNFVIALQGIYPPRS